MALSPTIDLPRAALVSSPSGASADPGVGLGASVAKAYVDNWKRNGELLERELATYLQTMTDDENRRVIQRVFAHTHPVIERSSGLLEQQTWFAKLRK